MSSSRPTSKPLTLTCQSRDTEFEAKQAPLEFRLIARLYQFTRPYAALRNTLFVMVVVRAIQLPLLAWMIGAVINGPISAGDRRGTLLGAAGVMALAAFTQLVFSFRHKMALLLGEHVVHDLRAAIFQHLLAMPIGFYDRVKLGRIISRITSDVESVRMGVQNALFVSMVLGGQMLMAAVMMAMVDVVMFTVLLGMAPVIYYMNRLYRRHMSDSTRKRQESFSRVTATLAESVNGIRVTQGFNRQDVNADIFSDLIQDHARFNINTERATAVFIPLLELNTQVFIALLLVIGGYRVLSPAISMPVGSLIQFFFLAGIFFQPFQNLGRIFEEALCAMAGAERVFHLLDTSPDWQDAADAVEVPPISGNVRFDHVSFAYNPGNLVLKDINLDVKAGQMIALVGQTGSGKSTITNLLAKFYLPSQGQIYIDEHEIRTITGESLHQQMGIIQQENYLFSGSIMENIRLGRPGAADAEVIAAARSLDCLDLIEDLPDGFATEVGEKGASLSLGQRQIVCFIRAMLADPRILVLDEATSSVDAMTEARIQNALAQLMRNRTSFVVAHRLSTIRHADEVLVLDHARIIERGQHLQLLERNGAYAKLYRQFIRADHADAADD